MQTTFLSVLGTRKSCLIETVLLSTHNLGLSGDIRKLIFNYTLLSGGIHTFSDCDDKTGVLTLYLLVSSADYLCKQFGPRSGPIKHRA